MAPHSSTAHSRAAALRRSSRRRAPSESSVSSASSSGSDSSASSISDVEVSKKAISRSDSETSDSSLASTASMASSASSEAKPGPSRRSSPRPAAKKTVAAAGGVKKRTKRARLTRPKAKREYKPRKDAVEKILREEASAENFPLADLEWSHWKRAMQRKNPQTSKWEPRFAGHPGARRRELFDDMTSPAVYEVAVKVPEHKEKIPVLASIKQGVQGQSWEAAILSKDKLRSQVDRVLRRNCKLYVRRAPFSVRDMRSVYDKCDVRRKAGAARSTDDAVHELRGLMARVCDYAWRDHYDIPSRTYNHRALVVKGIKVSD